MRDAAFPDPGDHADVAGLAKAGALAIRALRHDRAVSSPAIVAQDTAAALGISVSSEAALRDINYGAWSGRSVRDVQTDDPDLLAAWLVNPADTALPEGDNVADVVQRVRTWLDEATQHPARILAISHPIIIRAAIAVALECPMASVFSIDIVPLTTTAMSFNGKWRLQSLNARLAAL
jgi:broad specificity phosphatase PhoE